MGKYNLKKNNKKLYTLIPCFIKHDKNVLFFNGQNEASALVLQHLNTTQTRLFHNKTQFGKKQILQKILSI